MATHSSVLAWRIPGTGEPGGLPSMGSRRVGHDWSDLAAAAAAAVSICESQTPNLSPPTPPFCFGNHKFVFYVWVCFSFVWVCLCHFCLFVFKNPHVHDITWHLDRFCRGKSTYSKFCNSDCPFLGEGKREMALLFLAVWETHELKASIRETILGIVCIRT